MVVTKQPAKTLSTFDWAIRSADLFSWVDKSSAKALIGSGTGLVLLSVRAFLAEIRRDSMGLKGRAKLRVPCPLAGTGTTERKGDRKNVGKTH